MTATTALKVKRLKQDQLTALLGADGVANLQRKNRGGANGAKGARYEQLFGSHRIARLARKLVKDGADALVEWQSEGFVDDLVVRRDGQASFKGYQLKDAKQVSWTAGEPSLQRDFSRQWQISSAENYADIRLRLVCSDPSIAASLQRSVPEEISSYSGAFFFPQDASTREVLAAHPWIAEDFGFLHKKPNPSRIEIDQVASVLMGAWNGMGQKALVSEVLAKARSMSPTLVRALRSDEEAHQQLTPAFRETLGVLTNFQYVIQRGFFHWSTPDGSTSGVLSFDCFSESFRGLQQRIVKLQPKSFEDIEGELV